VIPSAGRWRLAGALAIAGAAWFTRAGGALADSPSPSVGVIGDPRAGQTASFVGDPMFAVAVVALIAIVAVAATLAWVRATGGPGSPDAPG
jgi:hypothetical protein